MKIATGTLAVVAMGLLIAWAVMYWQLIHAEELPGWAGDLIGGAVNA